MKIETEIINVLNQSDCEIVEIKNELSSVWKRRRGENRKLVDCVIRLLDYYFKDRNTDEVIIIEEEAEIVRRIYDLYLQGYGLKNIAHQLNAEGVKSPLSPTTAQLSKSAKRR